MSWLSGLNAASFSQAEWPDNTAVAVPVSASQIRAVRSVDIVKIERPSGLGRARLTAPLCPERIAMVAPVSPFHIRAVWSYDPVSTWFVPGTKLAENKR